MAGMKTIAESIANLVHAGADASDIGALMDAAGLVAEPQAAVELLECAISPEHKGWQIVVLQRGWVVVGDVTREGDELVIADASVIRYWGTKKGLGELVEGPLEKTILDPAGIVRANVLGVVLTIDVKAEKWAR